MNLFFGKITKKVDDKQLEEGFYSVKKDEMSWFNGIQIGDYTYIIGGSKIQLWKAKNWEEQGDRTVLRFEIIIENIPIEKPVTKYFASIKYFSIDTNLIVLSVRSTGGSRKAFFRIDFDERFSEEMLKDPRTYENADTYRKIVVLNGSETIPENTDDIYIFKKDGRYNIKSSKFINAQIAKSFKDNTNMVGKGSKNKDKTIKNIINSSNKHFLPKELSIIDIYDLFCCDYKVSEKAEVKDKSKALTDKTKDEENSNNANSANGRECFPLNLILYGPPGTGKTYNTINKALEIITETEKDELELRLIIEEKEEKIKISGLKEIITQPSHRLNKKTQKS